MIDEGVITTDRDYIYYLTDKLTYKYSGDNYCLKFTDEDMEKIINTDEIYRKDGREAGANPVVFVHKDNSFEKIENANYIYIDSE